MLCFSGLTATSTTLSNKLHTARGQKKKRGKKIMPEKRACACMLSDEIFVDNMAPSAFFVKPYWVWKKYKTKSLEQIALPILAFLYFFLTPIPRLSYLYKYIVRQYQYNFICGGNSCAYYLLPSYYDLV